MSEAEFDAIVGRSLDPHLLVPLEAKSWSRQTLINYIDSGGLLRPESCSLPDQRQQANTSMTHAEVEESVLRATEWLLTADALLVGSGAGMGVDSGLSTFRGKKSGVWPGLEEVGLKYEEICQPRWFEEEPRLAWAFWSFCHGAYQEKKPHEGYNLVGDWATGAPLGSFSFTSNIDSHWQASGWDADRLVEVHGTVKRLQCTKPCHPDTWEAPLDLGLKEDENTHRVLGELPKCPHCQALARPSVQMFGADKSFSRQLRNQQAAKFDKWLAGLAARPDACSLRIVCLELGCGLTVPTVRKELEGVLRRFPSARYIRVNPEHPGLAKELLARAVSLPLGAGKAISRLQAERRAWWWGRPQAAPRPELLTCVFVDGKDGAVELEVPIHATVEQIVHLVRRQPGVELEVPADFVTTIHRLMGQSELPPNGQMPPKFVIDIGEARRVVSIKASGVTITSGICPKVQKRIARVMAMLDDYNEAYGSEEYKRETAELTSMKSINAAIKRIHEKILPLHGLKPGQVLAMQARVEVVYRLSKEVARKADLSMELSRAKRREEVPAKQ